MTVLGHARRDPRLHAQGLRARTSAFTPDENLLATGIVDSIGILKLVTFLEERFGFQADDDDLVPENFMTLQRIQAFVERKRKP